MTWTDVYQVLFGREIDDNLLETWEALLDEDFPGRGVDKAGRWTPDELKAALKAVSEDRRKAGQRQQAPDYPAIKSAMIRGRYEARREDETPETNEECGLCGNQGLLMAYHTLPADVTLLEKLTEYRAGVPCFCAKGRKVLASTKDFGLSPRLEHLRKLGKDQMVATLQECRAYER